MTNMTPSKNKSFSTVQTPREKNKKLTGIFFHLISIKAQYLLPNSFKTVQVKAIQSGEEAGEAEWKKTRRRKRNT